MERARSSKRDGCGNSETVPAGFEQSGRSQVNGTPIERDQERFGLCSDCSFARQVRSDQGSTFLLCGRSKTDPRFPKYPRLPVLACDGYERRARAAPDREP